ncbi:MAG: ATP synthase gamma chain [Bacteroidia bacterium]|nr:MAG: ATP synthase gamma chain [Bacteroidia bacterium]
MPNLKEVRNRITSVNSTSQITSAMKMVSAAKLRRAQDAITQLRPYASKLKEVLENVTATMESSTGSIYAEKRAENNILIVPITSNRGLCGAFNANVIKLTNRLIREDYAGKNISIFPVGKKANDFFKKGNLTLFKENGEANVLFDKLTFDNVAPFAEEIMAAFANKQFDKVVLIYNRFKNAAVQLPTAEQLLPVEQSENTSISSTEYIYEPNKEFIVNELIPKSLKIQFYKALLDSHAAEHGARMTAMHKATDNAKELLRTLRISYNKARQAAITNEILEIVGGANALKG